jgi:adenine-specific DNA-methyltransferase
MKVMISGSRSIKALTPEVYQTLDKIIELNFDIVIGDCWGVDALVQVYLAKKNYTKVTVYYSGKFPRNNKGFNTVHIPSNSHTAKDIALSNIADYGLAIWDGKSKGTLANIKRVPKTKVIKVC